MCGLWKCLSLTTPKRSLQSWGKGRAGESEGHQCDWCPFDDKRQSSRPLGWGKHHDVKLQTPWHTIATIQERHEIGNGWSNTSEPDEEKPFSPEIKSVVTCIESWEEGRSQDVEFSNKVGPDPVLNHGCGSKAKCTNVKRFGICLSGITEKQKPTTRGCDLETAKVHPWSEQLYTATCG